MLLKAVSVTLFACSTPSVAEPQVFSDDVVDMLRYCEGDDLQLLHLCYGRLDSLSYLMTSNCLLERGAPDMRMSWTTIDLNEQRLAFVAFARAFPDIWDMGWWYAAADAMHYTFPCEN